MTKQYLLLAVTFMGLVVFSTASQDKRPIPTGTAELLVKAPSGEPLLNASIDILPVAYPKPKLTQVKTDGQGKARLPLPIGTHQLAIVARGIGFGGTGIFEVSKDATTRPGMPALVPFGSIEGAVAKKALKPGSYLDLEDNSGRGVQAVRDEIDVEGRFVLKDVPPGIYWLGPRAGEDRLDVDRKTVKVSPGERVTGVNFPPIDEKPQSAAPPNPPELPQDKPKENVVWAHGTVRDEKGQPVKDAAVYVVARYDSGIREGEIFEKTNSDDKGRWKVEGPWLELFSGSICVCKEGHPPAIVPIPPLQVQAQESDVVLPAQGGTLEVMVLRDGKPAPDVAVLLSGESGLHLFDRNYAGTNHTKEREEVDKTLYPLASTDAQGLARFQHLSPGTYQIFASADGAENARRIQDRWGREKGNYAIVRGVPVRSGEIKKFTMKIYPQYNFARFQVRHHNGQVPPQQRLGVSWGPVSGGDWNSGSQLDEQGMTTWYFDGPGLWNIAFRYDEPHYEARAVVAVSPLLDTYPPKILTAGRRETAKLLVQLQDLQGKPARGFVMASRIWDAVAFAGTTTAQGEVLFEGLQQRQYPLEAFLPGVTLPELGSAGETLPEDKLLVGRAAFFKQTVNAALDKEIRITVRPKAVGYVRGLLKPAKGRTADEYRLSGDDRDVVGGWSMNYNKKTGEFVAGPYSVGKATLALWCWLPSGDGVTISQPVEIASERVVRVEIQPPDKAPARPAQEPAAVFLGMGGLQMLGKGDSSSRGRVFLPDGKTPVFAAHVALFQPGIDRPVGQGQSDALGRLLLSGAWYGNSDVERKRPGSPTEPVLVALLPGSHGAAIVPIQADNQVKQDMKIVLPPSLSLHGKLTVGGKEITSRNNCFEVVAAYEGHGNLDALLSLHVSVQADGAFELPGLTPGSYRIQAAMDGIWLSESVPVKVGSAVQPASLNLDIGEPGTPGLVEIIDAQGKPVTGAEVTIPRPDGPLAQARWPAKLFSDGAGVVHVPPLEAGAHRIRVAGLERDLIIRPLALDRSDEPARLRVIIDGKPPRPSKQP